MNFYVKDNVRYLEHKHLHYTHLQWWLGESESQRFQFSCCLTLLQLLELFLFWRSSTGVTRFFEKTVKYVVLHLKVVCGGRWRSKVHVSTQRECVKNYLFRNQIHFLDCSQNVLPLEYMLLNNNSHIMIIICAILPPFLHRRWLKLHFMIQVSVIIKTFQWKLLWKLFLCINRRMKTKNPILVLVPDCECNCVGV